MSASMFLNTMTEWNPDGVNSPLCHTKKKNFLYAYVVVVSNKLSVNLSNKIC